jgi:hypothetical protein
MKYRRRRYHQVGAAVIRPESHARATDAAIPRYTFRMAPGPMVLARMHHANGGAFSRRPITPYIFVQDFDAINC